MKRILALVFALSLLCCLSLTAFAHDVPQERSDCSIEVIVRYDGKDVNGGSLTAVKVGYVDEDDGNFFFSQVITDLPIEDVSSADAPKAQKGLYDSNKDKYTFYTQTQPVMNGKAVFTGLSTGLYLIVQDVKAPGFSKLGEFLVSVPYVEDGEYKYNVTATIKSELEREPVPSPPPYNGPVDPQLPQTGQLNWPVPILAAAGLSLFCFGWILCFGKKKD